MCTSWVERNIRRMYWESFILTVSFRMGSHATHNLPQQVFHMTVMKHSVSRRQEVWRHFFPVIHGYAFSPNLTGMPQIQEQILQVTTPDSVQLKQVGDWQNVRHHVVQNLENIKSSLWMNHIYYIVLAKCFTMCISVLCTKQISQTVHSETKMLISYKPYLYDDVHTPSLW